ncbi:MAG TPA: tetratricopeptide repeat protein [Candidatus Acidoferrum sp.]|nr:tetratricopeptide repeat protein [Candidatus Acidoferrum sp.]
MRNPLNKRTLAALPLLATAMLSPTRSIAQTPPPAAQDDSAAQTYSQPDPAKRSEAFFDFAMGHLNEVYYLTTNQDSYAAAAIDFYKKAYALDPGSSIISEHLAEMYYEAHQVRDAVLEAQRLIQKDPSNASARKLLVRIYLRSLGDSAANSGQQDLVNRTVEQLEQIMRLDPKDQESALWLARLYRMRGESSKAEGVLRGLLSQNPNDEPVAGQEADLLIGQGRAQEAATLLEGIMKRAPSGHLADTLGDAYAQLHDFANAEQAYRQAIDLEPDEPDHYRGLAEALASEEKYADALAQYQHLAELEPEEPGNYIRMAEMDRQLNKLDDAEKNILEAKRRAPGNLEVVYSESQIYEAQGRYDDAIQVLSSAVESLKSQPEAAPSNRRSLAVLYEQLGRINRDSENFTAALNNFADLAKLGPEEAQRADLQIIETFRLARDLPHALEAADKALGQFPQDREIRIARALLFGEKGDVDGAASQLRQLLTRSQQDIEIYLDISQVEQQSRRFAEAEAALAQADGIAVRNNEREMIWYMLGAIYEREKKYDLAEEQFKKVLAVNPRSAPTLNDFGYMLADRGIRLTEATDMIKRALAEEPASGAYLDSLGWSYYKQDRLAEAEDTLRQAIAREHNDPTILDHLGDVYFKRGKLGLAQAQWERSLAEWHKQLPAEVEPDRIAAVEAKLANVKRLITQ